MSDTSDAEYESLRHTIRERGTVRLCAVLVGWVAWGALVTTVLFSDIEGAATLVPLLLLAGTFEINFFIHTGVERIGRYIQIFYEERAGTSGWETTAMHYGATYPSSGLDPLFSIVFASATVLNYFSAVLVGGGAGWAAFSLLAHLTFGYRIYSARKRAASQRALDLERFRNIATRC